MPDTPRIEAIDRALQILLALAEAGPAGAALTDIVESTGINKSTAYRALSTMRPHLFVTQAPDSGRYYLGPVAMSLGDTMWSPAHLAEQLHPALVALSTEVDELVHLGTWVENQVLYVDKVEPQRAIRVWSAVGNRVPVASSSLGRALLAARDLPDDELDAYCVGLDRPVPPQRLREAVRNARRLGYATEVEENEKGIACVGMAVLREGRPLCAISITAPVSRMSPGRMVELAATMRSALAPRLPDGLTLVQPGRA